MAEEESMTTEIPPIDSDDEDVFESEVQRPPAMNPKLLEAARSGDKRILGDLLRPKDVSSGVSLEEISITVPEGAATQEDTSCLLGVTVGGNTVLHIVAGLGHLELAEEVYQRERSLLAARNKRLDTPLHCAARTGNHKMVSLLIRFAREDGIKAERVLRARNRDKANALHEAAKYGHVRTAMELMEEDGRLACVQNRAGMSPLYLAIVVGSFDVATALLKFSSVGLPASQTFYAGPDKKTALHAVVVLNSLGITKDILRRNPKLAEFKDSSGRIPLHYAASYGCHSIVEVLLKHNSSTAYEPDANGSFPIHMAASRGNVDIVDQILQNCPDTDELLDKEGGNFLHAAFQRKKLDVVKKIISQRPYIRRLLNEQDGKGNTLLHMAVENADKWSVYFLLQDKSVCLNFMNHDGFTPRDLVDKSTDTSMTDVTGAKQCIFLGLLSAHALSTKRTVDDSREEQTEETKRTVDGSREEQTEETIRREQDLLKNIAILSVLIATVTFAAGFTPPGGYIADDRPGRGTAVLAKEYAFKVFIISDAFALVCSILATCCAVIYGTAAVSRYRKRATEAALLFITLAMVGMSAAFAMGIYAALAPTCKTISILLCFIVLGCPLLASEVIYNNFHTWLVAVISAAARRNCILRLIVARLMILFLAVILFPLLGSALLFLTAMIKSSKVLVEVEDVLLVK